MTYKPLCATFCAQACHLQFVFNLTSSQICYVGKFLEIAGSVGCNLNTDRRFIGASQCCSAKRHLTLLGHAEKEAMSDYIPAAQHSAPCLVLKAFRSDLFGGATKRIGKRGSKGEFFGYPRDPQQYQGLPF